MILYELNEVPWAIVDRFVRLEPRSALASLLERCATATTVNDDPTHLQPWRTWPTFHTGLYAAEHGSLELGQDPGTFGGEPVWEAAERAGRTVGLFGVMQTWPARPPANGGFWVPDTFARSASAYPDELETFQRFNLSMTAENSTSSNAPLGTRRLIAAGADMMRRGLRPGSVAEIVRHLMRERRDPRWKGARPMLQVLASFDLYWRLHRRVQPDLSIFFTNHVAGMMHRYWGDAVEEYAQEHEYDRDEIFATFLDDAMRKFDRQLAVVLDFVDGRDDTTLLVASSMGQGAVPYRHIGKCYVLRDPDALREALHLPESEPGLAMHPHHSFQYATPDSAARAAAALQPVQLDGVPLFKSVDLAGTTVSLELNQFAGEGPVHLKNGASAGPAITDLAQIGVVVEERLGGGNTAYHIPEGIWLAHGPRTVADPARERFSVLDAKARVLDLMGV